MDFNKQVRRMIQFIDQEGNEKMAEIDSRADEEVHIALGNIIVTERINVNNHYRKLEKAVEKQKIVQMSLMANKARMEVHKLKETRLEALFAEIFYKMKEDMNNISFYKNIFQRLVLQALCLIMEKNVGIRIRKKDKNLIKELLPQIVKSFHEMSNMRVTFEVDGRVFLDEDSLGGIVMYALEGRIRVENTIRSRLALVRSSVTGFLRYHLFGVNPNRKFLD